MFDFDAGKLMIIATVALVVIGPKDLPRVLRQLGQMVTRVKRMAGDFQNQFMDAMKEADIQDLRAEVAKLKDSATLDVDFDPAKDIKSHLNDAMKTTAPFVPTPNFGSTSEQQMVSLPASSEVASTKPVSSSGAASAFEIAALPEPPPAPAMTFPQIEEIHPPVSADEKMSVDRKKALVVRRRVGSRFDGSGVKHPAWQRSRNILPARRETPER